MKLAISALVIASLSLSAFGANIKARSSSSIKDNCPTAEVLTTTTYNVNGHEITRQTFNCPDSGFTRAIHPSSGISIPSSTIEKRNAGECRTAAPECQCGTSCRYLTYFVQNSIRLRIPFSMQFRASVKT